MKTFLLEIGTEEIPAGYIDPALAALASTLSRKLDDARITHGPVRTFGTPRRLTVTVAEVAARQKPLTRDVLGPPRRAAYDAQGQPTVAAVKFAEKVGLPMERLGTTATAKGEYLSATVTDPGMATPALLASILPEIILGLPFPKSMRWGSLPIAFARPIHSLLALFGKTRVDIQLGGIRSGRASFGHRFVHPRRVPVPDPAAYVEALRAASVIVDIDERRSRIDAAAAQAASGVGGAVLADEELLGIVTHLVEYPAIAVGRFSEDFLELPPEVLITAMREHQKYFAVVNTAGRLLPYFIAVNNTPATDMAVVIRGHERVLRARLEDAKFFYRSDRDMPLERQAEKLKNVLFQAQLGSIHDKVSRVGRLARFVAEQAGGGPDLVRHAERAARLCKADLVSQMVGEFPKLQGIMGRVYARAQGEDEAVARAIEEHYRPTYSGGPLPESEAGAILAVADKLDTICGCFRAGLIPSGAADPYALRRQGIGLIQIMRSREWRFPLGGAVVRSLELYGGAADTPADTAARVQGFLEGRMASTLVEEGFAKDTVAAVLGVASDSIPAVWSRARALEALRKKPDFEPIAVSFKRVVNILRRAEGFTPAAVAEGLFSHPSEGALLRAFREVESLVQADLGQGRYDDALARVATLRAPVDALFDDVMVMADDPAVRRNRLSLLALIAALFDAFADFSKLAA
jgi:glycyl-tRNA synthetase beta chain